MIDAIRTFFDPNSRYGSQNNPAGYRYRPGEFAQSPVGRSYANDSANFGAIYDRSLAGNGVDPMSTRGKFMAGMAPRLQTGYRSALLTNPMLGVQDYLSGQMSLLNRSYLGAGASEQGRNQGLYAPVARTQARGF